jgi:hypothetical protein
MARIIPRIRTMSNNRPPAEKNNTKRGTGFGFNGRVTDFGKIEGAQIVPSRDSDETYDRENFTRKRIVTDNSKLVTGPYGSSLAGGSKAREDELRANYKAQHQAGDWDALDGTGGT